MDDTPKKPEQITDVAQPRRTFIKQSLGLLGGGALISLLPPGMSAAVWAAGTDGLETTRAKLGFIALTDAAPLFVAEQHLFSRAGDAIEVADLSRLAGKRVIYRPAADDAQVAA